MKFVKGMFIGGLVTTGIMMMYLENENKAKRNGILVKKQLNLKSIFYVKNIKMMILL